MALKKCKECGHEISTNAKACPNCGAVQPKIGCTVIFFITFVVLIFASLISNLCDKITYSDYTEVGVYEQNKDKVYSYFAKQIDYDKIEKHAKKRKWKPGGLTSVFYFDNLKFTPDVSEYGTSFPEIYELHCVAGYWKYPTGHDKFVIKPFKK